MFLWFRCGGRRLGYVAGESGKVGGLKQVVGGGCGAVGNNHSHISTGIVGGSLK